MSKIVSVERNGSIAVLTITKEPVNTMDLGLWQEVLSNFEALEADPQVRAVVFRSGLKRSVFTAGLDINELYAPRTSRERLMEFWTTLSKTLVRIYASPMVTAAAINGACPAGGCCLSLCCDLRLITPDGSLGLNEVQLGIAVPEYWAQLFVSVTGQRTAERLLQLGEMTPSKELLQLGMVDKVVPAEELMPAALETVGKRLQFPDPGRVKTKGYLRADLAERWNAGMQREAEGVWAMISQPSTVASLTKVLERLSGGKKASSKL